MSDDPRPYAAPRAPALADLPLEALLGRAEELARRWAIALVRARPLEAIDEIPFELLAREAPEVCSQVLRALGSDRDLERLSLPAERAAEPAALRIAAITGADAPAEIVAAVEALRGVLWEALLDQLSEPVARTVADLGDRLATVCSSLSQVALGTTTGARPAPAPADPEFVVAVARPSTEPGSVAPAGGTPAMVVDERAGVPVRPTRARPAPPGPAAPAPGAAQPAEIEVRDERREDGPVAWVASIGRQLERYAEDGLPFAVLLIELLDGERLRRDGSVAELARLSDVIEGAIVAELRLPVGPAPRDRRRGVAGRAPGAGSLTRQSPGRHWLLAPETDARGAHRLAERLRRAAAAAGRDAGVPLRIVIGTAVCPEDGHDAPTLAAQADLGLYGARRSARAAAGGAERRD